MFSSTIPHAGLPPAPRPIRAIAIDLDGTLLDTLPDLAAAANAMLARMGHRPLAAEQVRTMIGGGMAKLVRRALARADGAEPGVRAAARALEVYECCYAEVLGAGTRPFPGVVEGITAFRERGLKVAVITNKLHRFAVLHLDRLGLLPLFDLVVGGDTLPAKKPDPLPLLHTARVFGIDPSALLMLGDSCNDTEAARAAGCPVLVVPWGYSEGVPVHELDADGIVESFAAVCERLDHLAGCGAA